MKTTAVVSATLQFATISFVPDSEGHKSKLNENNTVVFNTQQHNKQLSCGPVLVIMYVPQIAGAYLYGG